MGIGHDFLSPQPIKDASFFLLKAIMHDWSDERASIILAHLRDAVSPRKTRLLVIDRIVPYACRSTDDDGVDNLKDGDRGIPVLIKADGVPEFLLPNLGAWGPTPYHADLNVRLPTCMCICICPIEGTVHVTLALFQLFSSCDC